MKLLALVIFALSVNAQAFTLNNNFGASFNSKRVKVMVADNSTCGNALITVYELMDLISPSINLFWNQVPSSSLRLIEGGPSSLIANINDGKLCAPTDDPCITAATTATPVQTLIEPVNEIIIACNSNKDNFGNSSNVLAVTVPNHFKGKRIKGAVILINNLPGSIFGRLSRNDRIGVLAHEIGHALGLGHSTDTSSLMYYKTVNLRRTLGQDDVDGISYLYPVKMDGCGLIKGSITLGKVGGKGPPSLLWQMCLGFLAALVLAQFKKLFNRAKTRATA